MLCDVFGVWGRKAVMYLLAWTGLVMCLQLPALAIQDVVLTWNPSTNSDVAGYNIYFGTQSHVYTNIVGVGNVTNTTINGLVEGTTYYFSATSYDSETNQSPFSNETTYTVPATVIPPPETNNPVTNNPVVDPPVTNNPVVDPPVTNNPVVDPPVTNNPVTNNPVVNPPSTNSPATNITSVVYYPNPTLDAISNLTLDIGAPSQTVELAGITSGVTNGKPTLKITAASSDPGLAEPTVSYTSPSSTGKLTFKPGANATGTATITVTVKSNETNYNTTTQSFTVTVTNAPPTINSISNLTLDITAPSQTVALTGITSGSTSEHQSLKVTATSSNTGLIKPSVSYNSPGSTGKLTLKSTANVTGSTLITVSVNDGNLTTQTSFTVTVTNAPPTINPIANLTLNENAPSQIVPLTGITSGATNENQSLKVTVVSGNTSLIKPTVSYSSPKSTGELTFKPAANTNGTSLITVFVSDGNLTTQTSFTVTVLASAPEIKSDIANASSSAQVAPGTAPTITSAGMTNGQFTFQVSGSGQYVVQASSDLINWSPVETNTAPFTFSDGNSTSFTQRFYRAHSLQ